MPASRWRSTVPCSRSLTTPDLCTTSAPCACQACGHAQCLGFHDDNLAPTHRRPCIVSQTIQGRRFFVADRKSLPESTAVSLSLVHRVPAAGTSSASGRYFECQRPVLRVPAAGTSSASGWYFECQRLAIRLPRAGNSITSGWQFDYQRLAIRLPAADNSITKGWQFDHQGLAVFS